MILTGDVNEETGRQLDPSVGVRPEDLRGGARAVERGAEDRQGVVTVEGADRRAGQSGGHDLDAPVRLA